MSKFSNSDRNGRREAIPSDGKQQSVKVADFSSRTYWEQRFKTETTFEWLQPSDSLLPTIESEISNQGLIAPSILHLGCGTSYLSNHLRTLLARLGKTLGNNNEGNSSFVMNVDFAAGAIEKSRHRERAGFGDEKMCWAVIDVLDRPAFAECYAQNCAKEFDILVEKSYCDALACGEDIPVMPWSIRPELSHPGNLDEVKGIRIAPEAAAAIYLASVTRQGGVWIALSYSSSRFDFLKSTQHAAASLWNIENVDNLVVWDADTNPSRAGAVHRPQIEHYLYILRRTNTPA